MNGTCFVRIHLKNEGDVEPSDDVPREYQWSKTQTKMAMYDAYPALRE